MKNILKNNHNHISKHAINIFTDQTLQNSYKNIPLYIYIYIYIYQMIRKNSYENKE